MELRDQIAELTRRAEDARQRAAVAEAARDQAREVVLQALQALSAEFGVASAEEAQALLAQLEAKAATEAGNVTRALEVAGA